MVENYICDKCEHLSVCSKINALQKFNDESKKFIGIDITMESCRDFKTIEVYEKPISSR